MIISFTGAHSTGKTTAVYSEAWRHKIKYPELSVGIVADITRKCPFETLSKEFTPGVNSQLWIFSAQLNAELEQFSKFDTVISDRTVYDSIAYTKLFNMEALVGPMLSIAKTHSTVYEKIYFRLTQNNDFITKAEDRNTDKSIREKYESVLIDLYRTQEVPVIFI
jgi:thymidylate kinase